MRGPKVHWSKMLKAFCDGSAGGLVRIELRRLDLIDYRASGYFLTKLGRKRAERLGYVSPSRKPESP